MIEYTQSPAPHVASKRQLGDCRDNARTHETPLSVEIFICLVYYSAQRDAGAKCVSEKHDSGKRALFPLRARGRTEEVLFAV